MQCSSRPVTAGTARKNSFLILQGRPCKLVEVGNLPNSKVKLVGIDIFTSRKIESTFGSDQEIEVPEITRTDYSLVDISADGFLSLMDDVGDVREDIMIPGGDLGAEINQKFEDGVDVVCTVLAWRGHAQVVGTKSPPS